MIALTWTVVLRIGEALAAQRFDLILPEDAAPGAESAILNVRPGDVLSSPPSSQSLHRRTATLRRRFAQLQTSVRLVHGPLSEPICSLSSLRPGGATFWRIRKA